MHSNKVQRSGPLGLLWPVLSGMPVHRAPCPVASGNWASGSREAIGSCSLDQWFLWGSPGFHIGTSLGSGWGLQLQRGIGWLVWWLILQKLSQGHHKKLENVLIPTISCTRATLPFAVKGCWLQADLQKDWLSWWDFQFRWGTGGGLQGCPCGGSLLSLVH